MLTTTTAERELIAWLSLAFQRPRLENAAVLCASDLRPLLDAAGLDGIDPEMDAWAGEPEAWVERLEAEFVRLFVNSHQNGVAHPEALAYLHDAGQEAQTRFLTELRDELVDAGLTLDPDADRPADHLTVLLQLLYSLHGDSSDAVRSHPFAKRYLAGWIPEFQTRLEAANPPPFYRVAGRILRALII